MLKLYSFFSILALCTLLTSCNPIYNSEYSYTPPKSNIAKMCTANCVQGKNACQQRCRIDTENCRLRAQQNAIFAYENYKQEQAKLNMPLMKTLKDFDKGSSCSTSCDCETTYRACYSECGGTVTEHKKCVAFCSNET